MESIRTLIETKPKLVISEDTARWALSALFPVVRKDDPPLGALEAVKELQYQLEVVNGCAVCGSPEINTDISKGETPLCAYHQEPVSEV